MPRAGLRQCGRAGCGELVPRGVRFCPADTAAAPEREYDRERGSASSRGYGTDWRRRRDAHLRREPLCRTCAKEGRVTAATDVDHIVSRAKGGLDIDANYQSLCHAHHSAKTAREDGGFGRRREARP